MWMKALLEQSHQSFRICTLCKLKRVLGRCHTAILRPSLAKTSSNCYCTKSWGQKLQWAKWPSGCFAMQMLRALANIAVVLNGRRPLGWGQEKKKKFLFSTLPERFSPPLLQSPPFSGIAFSPLPHFRLVILKDHKPKKSGTIHSYMSCSLGQNPRPKGT